jgi:hypothetical protein
MFYLALKTSSTQNGGIQTITPRGLNTLICLSNNSTDSWLPEIGGIGWKIQQNGIRGYVYIVMDRLRSDAITIPDIASVYIYETM